MANNSCLLITRPEYDEQTCYLSAWSQVIIDAAREKGFKIIDLNENAKREILENRLQKSDPGLVVFNGHGKEDLITGYKIDEILVQTGKNEEILRGRITYSISCDSAKVLGPKSVEAGARAFIGFEGKFALCHEPWHSANPRRDKIAVHFLEPANTVPISLIKGNSVKEAYERSQSAFGKSIEYFETHYTPENSHILFWLRYDKKVQAKHGDDEAHL